MALLRIHLRKKGTRTTVSMERVLANVLSLQLCGKFDVLTVAKWCEKEIEKDPGAYEISASQRLSSLAVLEIAPKALQEQYRAALEQSTKANKLATARRQRKGRPGKRALPAGRK